MPQAAKLSQSALPVNATPWQSPAVNLSTQKAPIEGEQKDNVNQAKKIIESHEAAKKETDKMILALSDSKIRAKYVAKRQENRGYFGEMLDSVTKKFVELANQIQGFWESHSFFGADSSLGFLMLAPIVIQGAIALAAAAVIYAAATYASAVKREKDMQSEILADKSLSTADKAKLLGVVAGDALTSKAGAILLPLLLLGGAAFAFSQFKKSEGALLEKGTNFLRGSK